MIPDWLQPTFSLAPAMLWMFPVMGLPWALALLPRSAWRQRVTVLAMAMALGPVGLTLIMFFIGSVSTFSAVNVLLASALLTGFGALIAWRRRAEPIPEPGSASPLTAIDWTLIAAIAIGVVLRFWNTAYWPFTTYDALWVYGYNARVFMLEGNIPAWIGYYPQLLPLAFTYGQLLWDAINDHAARVVLPWFAVTGILMTYVLGARLFNRRAGLLAAAIWTLYPHHAVWSQFGDLEVTVTLYFTGAAACFALGWRERSARYIILSGLMMGGALWAKPTAGALIQSVALIGVAGLAWAWLAGHRPSLTGVWRWLRAQPILRDAMLALIVAFPIGGVWYIRNILFGHDPLVLPPGYWQEAAQRSGQELGWPLLLAAGVVVYLILRRRETGVRAARVGAALGGLALAIAASLPSAFGGRFPDQATLSALLLGQIPPGLVPTRLTLPEYALIAAGFALVAWAARPAWARIRSPQRGVILILAAFIAPYFITWFWSYSYHFRLSFPIVPVFAGLLGAAIAAASQGFGRSRLYVVTAVIVIAALAAPGWWSVLSALEPAVTGELADDDSKIARGNPALMALVDFLRAQREALDRPLRVVAPGELRLGFFFPQDDIRGDVYPLWLDEIGDIDFYIDSSVSHRFYALRGTFLNQIIASRTRREVMQRVFAADDGIFRFAAYTIDNAARFARPSPNGPLNVQIGDFAELVGYDLSTLFQRPGEALYLTLSWGAYGPAALDYSVFIHLWDADAGVLVAGWASQPMEDAFFVWQGVPGAHFSAPYATRLWQAGEFIIDDRRLVVPLNTPSGRYELRVGLFEPVSGERLPVTRDGTLLGDSILLNVIEIGSR